MLCVSSTVVTNRGCSETNEKQFRSSLKTKCLINGENIMLEHEQPPAKSNATHFYITRLLTKTTHVLPGKNFNRWPPQSTKIFSMSFNTLLSLFTLFLSLPFSFLFFRSGFSRFLSLAHGREETVTRTEPVIVLFAVSPRLSDASSLPSGNKVQSVCLSDDELFR